MSETSEHPNATRVRALFRAFREHDLETISASFHPDVVWRFPGRDGKLAGAHRGRDAVFNFLADVSRLTGDTFRLEVEDVLANEERAVVLFTGSGKRAGRTLNNPTCLVIRFEDGKAVELREFVWDLRHVDEFWS